MAGGPIPDRVDEQPRRAAWRVPDTYLLLAGVGLLVFALTWFVAPGYFETREVGMPDGGARLLIDPQGFHQAPRVAGAALFSLDADRPGLFNAVYEGLVSGSRTGGAVGIIAFILLTGGAFGIVMATGAVDRALRRLIGEGVRDPRALLAALFVCFSLGGAVFGMGEEVIPFVLLLVPVLSRLGYDAATVVLVTYVATQIGFATSWMNPFSVAIAQGIAGLPLLSGMGFRIAMWALFTAFGIAYMLRYAGRIRQATGIASGLTATAAAGEAGPATDAQGPRSGPLAAGDWLVLMALLGTVLWIVWGVVFAGYYLPEIATQFVVLGVACGMVGCLFRLDGMTANGAAEAFRQGAMALLPAALIIGFARGIVYLMGGDDPSTPSLLNTALHAGSESLGGLPGWLAAWLMLAGQSVFNFFVTSGSGQAALTMPILAPLSDLLGVTRQVAVLAFQLGDGLTNILVPTSAALMGCLGAARLEWSAWIRTAAPLGGGLLLLASGFVILAALSGFA